jgi:hypothetical protein
MRYRINNDTIIQDLEAVERIERVRKDDPL